MGICLERRIIYFLLHLEDAAIHCRFKLNSDTAAMFSQHKNLAQNFSLVYLGSVYYVSGCLST